MTHAQTRPRKNRGVSEAILSLRDLNLFLEVLGLSERVKAVGAAIDADRISEVALEHEGQLLWVKLPINRWELVKLLVDSYIVD